MPQLADSQPSDGQGETWVPRDRFPVEMSGLVKRIRLEITVRNALLKLSLEKEVISVRVFGWRLSYPVRFRRRKFCLQRVGNFLRHLTLDRKDILHVAIVSLGPEMR